MLSHEPAITEELVRDALAHLYDNKHLSQHPLLSLLVRRRLPDPVARAQQLRGIIMEAISALRPASSLPPLSKEWRPYSVLAYRYLDGLSDDEIQRRLAISERQFYRELKAGIELLTAHLAGQVKQLALPEGNEALSDSLRRVGLQLERLDLGELCREVQPLLQRLCQSLGKELQVLPNEAGGRLVVADAALARQALILVLSHALKNAAGRVLVTWESGPQSEFLAVRLCPVQQNLNEGAEETLRLAAHLMEQQGGFLRFSAGQEHVICLHWPPFESPAILVVEDDPGMQRLLGRYLEGHNYRVIATMDGAKAAQLAKDNRVSLVILDVMMRSLDGWAVLQQLKSDPDTAQIPVLVCSVINEPQLARSLGAAGLLRKPVTAEELLTAVASVIGI